MPKEELASSKETTVTKTKIKPPAFSLSKKSLNILVKVMVRFLSVGGTNLAIAKDFMQYKANVFDGGLKKNYINLTFI